MPRINIYEHSETYSFQTKNNSYATVAFPIAAIWGPTFVEGDEDANPDWVHFSSGYRGTTDFMATFRGANPYLGAREKSFDYALKLLAAGYDILVKRVDGLGNKSRNDIFVIPAGGTAPIPANCNLVLKPNGSDTTTGADYETIPYRFYIPRLSDNEIVWDYSYDSALNVKYKVTSRAKDATTGKWLPKTSEDATNEFRINAKTAANADLIVAFGKPNIITSQVKSTGTEIVLDGNKAMGKQVTVTGTVQVSVYTTDGTLLERRNITITETSVYKGANDSTDLVSEITVDSVLAPEFTYIDITALPAILSLKAAYDATANIYSGAPTTEDADADKKYGFFTYRLGEAWTYETPAPTPESAIATVSGTGVTAATVTAATFGTQVNHQNGTYIFTYDTDHWVLAGNTVDITAYGISITGTPEDSDTISVAYTAAVVPVTYIISAAGNGATIPVGTQKLRVQAKFPGSFGNNLKVRIKCGLNGDGFKIGTVEVFDNNGYNDNPDEIVPTDQLLELVPVAFEADAATDSRPLITEATFSNLDAPLFMLTGTASTELDPSTYPTGVQVTSLFYGTDYATRIGNNPIQSSDITDIVEKRFDTSSSYYTYIKNVADAAESAHDSDTLIRLYNQQMLYQRFQACVGELTDPIVYDWDALVQGIADDQFVPKSYLESNPEFTVEYEVSTLVTKMIEVAANSKCGAALIGTPFGMPRGIQTGTGASVVKTGALRYKDNISQAVGPTYSTFGEVVGPWCKTTLAIAGANSWIAPEIAHLLLIINAKGIGGQNKWWMIPAGMLGTGVVHTPEYKIKKKYLDLIQDHDEGVCLNPLMEVPGKGFTCFGNSTLWDKPLGTYNALQNLSTRFLTNRVKQRIWDTALQILFKYNNEDAYSHFYAGLSPLLDEMRAVGALVGNEYNPWGYRIIMNPDIVNLDRINANTVIGRVELAVAGVIDTVEVDLFLLPPTGFQETYD